MPPDFIPKPFHCDVAQRDGATHLRLRGELDLGSVAILEEQLRRARSGDGRRLVVDLRELEFMDSTGLTMLMRWSREADRDDGYDLALIRGEDRVHRLFEITGMVAYFTFVDG